MAHEMPVRAEQQGDAAAMTERHGRRRRLLLLRVRAALLPRQRLSARWGTIRE